MPQLSQLSEVLLSQLFWLAIGLGFIFFVIARGMVPKIQATVEERERKISADLVAAQQARAAADETEEAWRARMDQARSESAKLTDEAKQAGARHTEKLVHAASDKINAKIESAEARIREVVTSAQAEMERVAADVTREMVTKLTGLSIDQKDAAAAVKARLNV
jgi:F-type H+-transporting ATPase subunit b